MIRLSISKYNSMNKTQYSIAFIALILVAGYVGYTTFYAPPQEETTPNTIGEVSAEATVPYVNDTYGFSLEYTDEYTPFEAPVEGAYIVTFVRNADVDALLANTGATEGPTAMTIEIFPNNHDLSAVEWINAESRSNLSFGTGEYAELELNGTKGVTYAWEGLYQAGTIVFANNENIYMLTVTFNDIEEKIVADFNRMVSTFVLN